LPRKYIIPLIEDDPPSPLPLIQTSDGTLPLASVEKCQACFGEP
jgi:hypothetical protein